MVSPQYRLPKQVLFCVALFLLVLISLPFSLFNFFFDTDSHRKRASGYS